MKIFKCDSCGKEFPSPIDEEKYTDEHGVTVMYDLCAPCRKVLEKDKQKPVKNFFNKIKEKK